MSNLRTLRTWLKTREKCNHAVNMIDDHLEQNADGDLQSFWLQFGDLGYADSLPRLLENMERAVGYRGKYPLSADVKADFQQLFSVKHRIAREMGEEWSSQQNFPIWIDRVNAWWEPKRVEMWEKYHERFEKLLVKASQH